MSDEEDDGPDDELSAEELTKFRELLASIEYISEIPAAVPAGKILVHNHVVPHTRDLGLNGFRAWLADADPAKYVLCSCNWASELGWHYRSRAVADRE